MKTTYYIFFALVTAVLMQSCSAPYQVSTNVKLKYDWVVSDVQLEGDVANATITTPIFEDMTLPCLQNSKWSLYDEGSGAYTINSTDTVACVKGTRKITWEVVTLKGKSHYLQFYRYNAPKGIPTDRFTLYITEITSLTKNQMILKYPVKYHGLTGKIVLTMTR